MMRLPTGRLYLTPARPGPPGDPEAVLRVLEGVGFIGPALPGRESAYGVGPQFFQLLSFAGCAVQVPLEPSGDHRHFCHIRLIDSRKDPILVTGENTRAPRCPSCRAPDRNWRDLRRGPLPPARRCPACTRESPLSDWDWKTTGGMGRRFLIVEEIFPGEAVPTPRLLQALASTIQSPWRYFYIQERP